MPELWSVVGNGAFRLAGLPIGAIMSAVSVSLLLSASEAHWLVVGDWIAAGFHFPKGKSSRNINCLRYVDDIVGLSCNHCVKCVAAWKKNLYSISLLPLVSWFG